MLYLFVIFITLLNIGGFADNPSSSVRYGVMGSEQLHADFKEHLRLSPDKENRIGYLDFEKKYSIEASTYFYVKDAFEFFKKKEVSFVIVHLNTLGGALFPTVNIAGLFQKLDINDKIPLIAFIDKYAIGSGAILAYACRFIAVTQGSYMGGQLPGQKIKIDPEPDTIKPYILNEYASLAASYGRDSLIAEAMADIKVIVVERDGKLLSLYSNLDIRTDGDNPDKVLATDQEWLTLDADQMLKYGVADFSVSSNNAFVLKKETPFDETPLYQEPYLNTIHQGVVLPYSSFKTSILLFLTHPIVAAVLLLGVIISFYIQVKVSRFSKYSVLGLICLVLIIISSLSIQSVSWIEMLFLILGSTIILLDLVLAGGSSLFGSLGIGLTVVSLFMMLLPGFEKFSLLDFEAFSFAAGSLVWRVICLIFSLILSLFIILVMQRLVFLKGPKKKVREDLLFEDPVKEKDFLEKVQERELPKQNSEGFAHCSLRPFGRVVIKDKLYDAVSLDHKVILKKTPIVVIGHENGKVIVKERL